MCLAHGKARLSSSAFSTSSMSQRSDLVSFVRLDNSDPQSDRSMMFDQMNQAADYCSQLYNRAHVSHSFQGTYPGGNMN